MDGIVVRSATFNDLDTLYRFEQGIITTERPWDPTLKDGHIHYYDLRAMITAPHIELAVAELDGKLIGSGYARLEDSKIYLKHQKHAYLGFMYVEPEHRGKGVNRRVIEHLKSWAKLQGMTELRLDVYNDNQAAIKAYQKFGFTKLLIEMRMGID
jgi:GNAT superfamily N-acetyltransferase